MPEPVLSIRDLVVEFGTEDGVVHAVDGISYDVFPGETLGIVGESGSGKSVSTLSILGLIPQPPGRIVSGTAMFKGKDLLKLKKKELRKFRGDEVAMVFQDPMTSLNPVLRIGDQLGEAITTHYPKEPDDKVKERVIDLLRLVGVPNPDVRYTQYPHEFSGGMRQRAMIAMAIANSPSLLIADEPTTALDVTIQAQVLEVLKTVQVETHAATILITHDLGIVAELCERVLVMYAGKIVEYGDVHTIFQNPRHPYTIGLMDSLPKLTEDEEWLRPILGQPPSLINRPSGCAFHPRCFLSQGRLALPRGGSGAAEGRRRRRSLLGVPLRGRARRQALEVQSAGRRRWRLVSSVGRRRAGRGDPSRRRARQVLPDPRRPPEAHRRPDPRRRRRRPLDQRGGDARARRRVRLWQDDALAHADQARRADRRHDRVQRPGHHASEPAPACARCAARCRSCSRTRTRR